MNFSETLTYTSIVEFSPDSKYIALNRGSNLNIYVCKGASLFQSYPLQDVPTHILWSPNSSMVLTSHPKKCQIQIFALDKREWNGKITMSPNGMSGVWWTPDSLSICVVTDFQLRLTVWSLSDLTAYHIRNPKFEDKGFSFTSDNKFMLLAERSECKDYIGIYFVGDWQVVNHFLVETLDLEDAKWANDTAIIIIDNCVVYQLLIYSPLGHLIARHRPYDNGLGIKSYSLSLDGTFLAVGSYDSSARVFSKISWRFLTEFEHKSENNPSSAHVYKEEEYKEGYTDEKVCSRYTIQDMPAKLPTIKSTKDKPNPLIGISTCAWSCNSAYLSCINDNTPNTVWIWKMNSLSLNALLLQLQSVKTIEWSPRSLHLAICTGSGRLYFWSSEGSSVCEVPLESKDFKVNKVKWSPDGSCLMICDKNRLMLGYPKFDMLEANREEYY